MTAAPPVSSEPIGSAARREVLPLGVATKRAHAKSPSRPREHSSNSPRRGTVRRTKDRVIDPRGASRRGRPCRRPSGETRDQAVRAIRTQRSCSARAALPRLESERPVAQRVLVSRLTIVCRSTWVAQGRALRADAQGFVRPVSCGDWRVVDCPSSILRARYGVEGGLLAGANGRGVSHRCWLLARRSLATTTGTGTGDDRPRGGELHCVWASKSPRISV